MTRLGLLLVLCFALGCASADLMVIQPLTAPAGKVSMGFEPAPTVSMNDEQKSLLRTLLTSSLSSGGVSVVPKGEPGAGSVDGSITTYDPGNRALRWVIGFGAGSAHFDSTWSVKDPAGAPAGECRVVGSLYMGGFGGSYDSVLEKVGERLRECLVPGR